MQPGVQDSNAARAAVAANYMQACTGLWIVTPITRAVDDKTAKTLLGDSFKRQLQFDGTYFAVTFVCSKTDDIAITEAMKEVPDDVEEEISEISAQVEHLDREKADLLKTITELKDERADLDDRAESCDREMESWEELETKVARGNTIYSPLGSAKKRKRCSHPVQSRKSRNSGSREKHDSSDAEEIPESGEQNEYSDYQPQPVSREKIEQMIASIKEKKKEIRLRKTDVGRKISELRERAQELEGYKQKTKTRVAALCIKSRNNYSRDRIKKDFAAGMKE